MTPARKVVVLLVVTALAAVASTGSSGASDAEFVPAPLTGTPLTSPTGLQLVLASVPPRILDIDSGRLTPIDGIDARGNPLVGVQAAGNSTILWLQRRPFTRTPAAEIYLVRPGALRARRIATAFRVAPSADRSGIWLKSYTTPNRCTLREVTLAGRSRTAARPITCASHLVPTDDRPLLVRGSSIVDATSDRPLLRAPFVLALAEETLLTATGQQGSLVVTNLRTGATRRLGYPSKIRGQGGFDEALFDPSGRFAAISFGDPAYEYSGTQVTDVWVLDLEAGSLRQLPGMPAAVSLKATSMQWTKDGRLVILAQTEGRAMVVVWKPGQARLAVRPVNLPRQRSIGVDSFVVRS